MKRNNLWILILLFAMGSCADKNAETSSKSVEIAPVTLMEPAEATDDEFAGVKDYALEPRDKVELSIPNHVKIIKNGNVSIESKNITKSKKNLDALMKRFSAYYQQETTNNNNDLTSYNLIIRVPTTSFESMMTALESGEDNVTEKNISAEDVSLQYFDLQSRLKSKRAYLERYQAMVSSAKNVKELLEIQEQIRQLQEDIDSNEATYRNLSNQINYSTLTVNLFEYQANLPMGSNSFWVQIKESINFGWNIIENLILGIIGLWPVWIILGTLIFVIKKVIKKRKQKKNLENVQI
ncbi:DUF4349 domain-containing protein [Sphingobacterium daejeonense]|jgi:hypothetical protein|uniref:DUF4349 domain-containing protein n=1 Tax=Sphingobacterium daejeonense TaxID=371142 RepID=A0ABW3RI33_9SPHI|nr:DUF4349 domain-containing protein [Sphingobacterium daejeonense]MCT1531060.1 DUF4349 domain-containing protein [Sphingobacterium daejeonense]